MNARTTPSSTKSWRTFEVELKPQRRARNVVLVSAWILLLMGTVVILAVDLPVWARTVGVALWWVDLGCALGRLCAVQHAVRRLHVGPQAAGSVTLKGESRRAVWCLGTVITARWAWVRMRCGDVVYSELFLERAVETNNWRRLQVLWRWGERAETGAAR